MSNGLDPDQDRHYVGPDLAPNSLQSLSADTKVPPARIELISQSLLGGTVKPVLSSHSNKRPKIGFQDRLSLNAAQKYCRMLQGEHSAILLTFIKLPLVIKIFVLSIFEWGDLSLSGSIIRKSRFIFTNKAKERMFKSLK